VSGTKPQLTIRIILDSGRFGRGKAALLLHIRETGSISAAARALGMSYARAWNLTEEMNLMFHDRLVDTFAGGNRRGGASLTATGTKVLELYESALAEAERTVAKKLAMLDSLRG